ncbi:MAG: threonine-phosphate decarboxylase [Deltaproteobacteria bacterium]|nr:threonine-phosphate decarboxylase [Deltaproteobacteria bacterium]
MKDIHGGDIWEASRRAGKSPGEILDFSSSLNPFGLPKKAASAVKDALRYVSPYPDPSSFLLRQALSIFHAIDTNGIVPGNGSTELIYALPRVLRPERALIVEPAFSEYRSSLELSGCRTESLVLREEEGFRLDLDSFGRKVKRGYGAVYIANPSNPTGALIGKETLMEAARLCRKNGAWLIVDEAFMDFCEDGSVKSSAGREKNLIVLRSMTKFFSMAGLRLGFLIANGSTAERFRKSLPPWSVNTLAAYAAMGAVNDRHYIDKTRAWLGAERDFLSGALSGLGLKVFPSSANFLMAKTGSTQPPANEIRERLLSRGILIRDLSAFKGLGRRYLRVAVRTRQEDKTLINALRQELEVKRVLKGRLKGLGRVKTLE